MLWPIVAHISNVFRPTNICRLFSLFALLTINSSHTMQSSRIFKTSPTIFPVHRVLAYASSVDSKTLFFSCCLIYFNYLSASFSFRSLNPPHIVVPLEAHRCYILADLNLMLYRSHSPCLVFFQYVRLKYLILIPSI